MQHRLNQPGREYCRYKDDGSWKLVGWREEQKIDVADDAKCGEEGGMKSSHSRSEDCQDEGRWNSSDVWKVDYETDSDGEGGRR